jgi:hypothetical protein
MKITGTIDRERDLTIYRACGVLVWDEIRSIVQDQESGYLTTNTLWDLADVDISHLTIENVKEMIVLSKKITCRQGGKTAIVMSTESDYSFLKQYELLAESSENSLPVKTKIFRSRAKALDWIEKT